MAFFIQRCRSFGFAFRGIAYAFRTQPNIWIHSIAAVAALLAGIFLKLRMGEWIAVTVAIGAVFAAEMFNTAIEKFVDLVSPGQNEKAGIIKDVAAGAVLVTSLMALIIGCIVFLPKILQLLS